jgi:peptidoglycan/LPS O-acetylase OafA/YrhL
MANVSQRLPGLDGMRAIAVSFVLFSHVFASEGWVYRDWTFQLQRIFSGLVGVQVFFTISGFIITLLLLREKQASGTISLKQFWLRRAIRILPPALAFLLVLQVIAGMHVAPVPAETQWGSLLFYRNFMPHDPWFASMQGFTGHYWSLAVEEQFYLIWPLLVVALSMAKLRSVAWIGVGLSVICRACTTLLYGPGTEYWLPMNLDGFMIGALVAMEVAAGSHSRWRSLWRFRWPILIGALALSRLYASKHGMHVAAIQPLGVAVAAGVWIAGLIGNPAGIESRILNSRPLVALGLISYSVYLWQQLCLGPSSQWTSGKAPWLAVFPQNILTALACGALSYLLIEQPCQRLKNWIIKRRCGREDAAIAPCQP